jgi:hypothetical protein
MHLADIMAIFRECGQEAIPVVRPYPVPFPPHQCHYFPGIVPAVCAVCFALTILFHVEYHLYCNIWI